jgi:hypothetical protein
MKVEKRDAGPAKRILTAMITDSSVCGRIAAHWADGGLFRGKWENLVGGWCVRHYRHYEKSPGREIETAFGRWAEDAKDPDTVKLVENFLGALSAEYEQRSPENADYVVDLAAQHFNRNKMRKSAEAVLADLEQGDDARARERFNQHTHIELGVGAGIDVVNDRGAMREAFKAAQNDFFQYNEGLKYFFDGTLCPDSLIGFQASMKRGKTFWQIDLAWRAMLAKLRVAFFEIGDMSQNQIMRRFGSRAAFRPIRATPKHRPVLYPTFLEIDSHGKKCAVTHKRGYFRKPLDWRTAWKACKKITGDLESRETFLRLSCHPTKSVSVPDIVSILESWERARWVPQIIVIDYADLLAPINAREPLHQIEENWAAMRALSMQRHCLVVTATQAKATALRAETMNESHFSGNQLKYAHCNGMVGLAMTVAEKKLGITRVNWLARREGEFDTEREAHVAGALAIAQPAIKSIF